MNKYKLANAIRTVANNVKNGNAGLSDYARMDAHGLLCVLEQMIEGKSAVRAFGAPGDWGYDTPIGKALAEADAK